MKISRYFLTFLVIAFSVACGVLPSFAQVEGEKIAVSSAHPVPAIQDTETKAQRDARMAWWREARFGMFIHWGLYSIPAGTWKGKQINGVGEWIMNDASIPVAEYKTAGVAVQPDRFQRACNRVPG